MQRKGRLLPIFSVLRKYKLDSLRYFPPKVNIITGSFSKKNIISLISPFRLNRLKQALQPNQHILYKICDFRLAICDFPSESRDTPYDIRNTKKGAGSNHKSLTLLHPHRYDELMRLPAMSCGIATCLNRAIGTAGLSPAE